jgi:hypothetical protein
MLILQHGIFTKVAMRKNLLMTWRTRLITSFIGMDVRPGSDLVKGLAGLEAAAEKQPRRFY